MPPFCWFGGYDKSLLMLGKDVTGTTKARLGSKDYPYYRSLLFFFICLQRYFANFVVGLQNLNIMELHQFGKATGR